MNEAMHGVMLRYFAAEKLESWLFVFAGIAAITVSIFLWRAESVFRGMAFPLVVIGLIQIAVGGSILYRTTPQVAALSAQLAKAPADYKTAEVPRMEAVMRSFQIYKLVEIAFIVAGIILTYALRRNDWAYAIGVGLIIQGSLMLVFDLFAEHRGHEYLDHLRTL